MTPQSSDSDALKRDAESYALTSVMLAVAAFTAIVVARGIGGHLDRSLGGWSVFAVYLGMMLITGWAYWRRLRWQERYSHQSMLNAPLGFLLIACICPLLTAMVLGRDLTAGALTLLWLLTFVIAAGYVWLTAQAKSLLSRQTHPSATRPPAVPPQPAAAAKLDLPASSGTTSTIPTTSESLPDPDQETFSQRWIRREGDIGDELEGTLRIYFAVGQRTATADIPIVPAMASIPDVDCEPMRPGDADVQIIIRGVHTYGVRLELQRPAHRDAAEEIEVAVLIHAERNEE